MCCYKKRDGSFDKRYDPAFSEENGQVGQDRLLSMLNAVVNATVRDVLHSK